MMDVQYMTKPELLEAQAAIADRLARIDLDDNMSIIEDALNSYEAESYGVKEADYDGTRLNIQLRNGKLLEWELKRVAKW